MFPAIRIALLLLSATVVKSSPEVKTEEEDCSLQFRHDVRKRADPQTEEMLQDGAFPGSCSACKSIVSAVKRKLGSDHSKEKIRQLLNNACNRVKTKLIRSACKTIVRKFKNRLIDAIANLGSPRGICVKLRLCKRKKPVDRWCI